MLGKRALPGIRHVGRAIQSIERGDFTVHHGRSNDPTIFPGILSFCRQKTWTQFRKGIIASTYVALQQQQQHTTVTVLLVLRLAGCSSHLKLKYTSSRFSAISHWITVSLLELTTMKGIKILGINSTRTAARQHGKLQDARKGPRTGERGSDSTSHSRSSPR